MARRKAEFDIQANDKASAKLRKISGGTERLSKNMSRLKAVATGALAGLATGAAVRGLARLTSEGLRSVDALAKSADKLGTTTDNLRAYRNAAELAGVGSEKAEVGLQRFIRRLSEAAQGTGTAKDALKELGVDAAELNLQDPVEALGAISEAFQGVENQSDRVRLAFKLFDSEGVSLVNLLNQGSDAITRSRDLLDDLGLSLDRLDAAEVEEANDSFARLNQVSGAAKQRLAVELAPAIEAVFTGLLRTGQAGEDMGESIERGVGRGVRAMDRLVSGVRLVVEAGGLVVNVGNFIGARFGLALARVAEETVSLFGTTIPQGLNGLVMTAEDATTKMRQGFADFSTAVGNFVIAGMNKATEGVDALVNSAATGISELIRLANRVPNVNIPNFSYSQDSGTKKPLARFPVDPSEFGRVPTFGEEAGANLGSLAGDYDAAVGKNAREIDENLRGLGKAMEDLFDSDGSQFVKDFERARAATDDLRQSLDGGAAVPGAGAGGGGDSGGATGAAENFRETMSDAGRAAHQAFLQADDAGRTAMDSLGRAVEDFARTGELNFSRFARSVLSDLAAIQLKSALIGGDGNGGIIGAAIYGLAGGNTTIGAPSAVPVTGSYAGGGYTGSGARTGGMDGRGGFPAILHPDETVVDHRRGGGGGGTVINQTIEVRETLPSGQAREIVEAARAATLSSVQQINQRGGRRRAAFGLGS